MDDHAPRYLITEALIALVVLLAILGAVAGGIAVYSALEDNTSRTAAAAAGIGSAVVSTLPILLFANGLSVLLDIARLEYLNYRLLEEIANGLTETGERDGTST